MPNTCTTTVGSKITGQHLFLGASVISFTTNMAWGVNSTLTVSLVEDLQPCACYTESTSPCPTGTGTISGTITEPFGSSPETFEDDHYNTCVGDACYIDERGRKYNANNTPPPQERVVPGKIYYKQNSNGKYVSQYWTHEDPGFFGAATSINEVGGYDPDPTKKITYDIIGTPVVFRFDSFIFAGVIKSWEVIANTGGRQFSVIIESMDSLLANSHMILSNYSGAIFAIGKGHSNKEEVEFLGMPTPYTGDLLHYFGRILSGCLHNVFNVYGFLESMNWGKFGGANLNESGIPAVKIIDALRVLTSCTKAAAGNSTQQLKLLNKQAFSPFGRLLAPVMANSATLTRITESFKAYAFGVIPPTPDEIGFHRNEFVLDLSELPRPSEDFRISGITITIAEFISQLTSATGQDYYTTLLPLAFNNKPYNIIKIRTIDRTQSSPKGQITKALTDILAAGYTPTSATLGYEASNNSSRILVVGGPQQRLYQAKNYRLAYKQTSYIYHPIDQIFVLYDDLPNIGKMKMPDAFSVRNKVLSASINGTAVTQLFDSTEQIARALNGNKAFDAVDTDWTDTEVGGGSADGARIGNYVPSVKVFKNSTLPNGATRYIPIYMDTICPFFGYRFDQSLSTLSTDGSSNNFRYIRPVFLDSWTGCLNVVCDISELPLLWIGRLISLYRGGAAFAQSLPSSYSATMFVITETEMRAAMSGFDSYFSYCAAKSMPTKPDLFMMLVGVYLNSGITIYANNASWYSTSVTNLQSQLRAAEKERTENAGAPGIAQKIANLQQQIQQAQAAAAAGLPAAIAAAIAAAANPQNAANAGGVAGQPLPAAGAPGDIKQAFSFFINPNFLRDLELLVAFVSELGSKYYGQQYMVKVPEMVSYQDRQFADIQLPSGNDDISIFQGSGKLYFNYEPCDGGGWEEPGNIIDDSILVGGADWFSLCNEEGLIPPILGYNASDLLDVTAFAICGLNLLSKASYYTTGGAGRYDFQTLAEARIFKTCDEEKFRFKGLDITNLDPSEYLIKNTQSPRIDAFGKTIPSATYRSKKLYIKSSVGPTPIFLDPINLREPRIIVTTKGIPLPPSSLQYQTDPNSMVMSNVAIEDLSIYLRLTVNPDISFIAYMMHYCSPILNDKLLIGNNTSNQSAGHQMLSPKMAQPFFAGVPVKSKQFTYGPWTNFPGMVSDSIFPGLSGDGGLLLRQNAIENMIGKITVDIDDQLVPWKYGGMSFLDSIVINKINNNTDYQNIIENASFSIAGVPIFGIGGQCVAPVKKTDLSKIFINNDEYTISSTNLVYKDVKDNTSTPTLSGFLLTDILPQKKGKDPITDAIKIFNQNYTPAANATITTLTYHILETSCTNSVGGAPCISNLSITVGPEGFVTKYDLQTNSRKMGLFNKEFGDRLTKSASSQIKRNKEIQAVNKEISNLSIKQSALIGKGFKNKPSTPSFFGNSPTELLIGSSRATLKDPLSSRSADGFAKIDIRDKADAAIKTDLTTQTAKTPITYGRDPGNDKEIWKTGAITPSIASGMSNQLRQETWTGSFKKEEAWDEMLKEFSSKSAMSLDGIYSPVSFYPTLHSSTFAMASYPRKQCNLCDGKGYIEDQTVNNIGGSPSFTRASTLQAFACPGCSRSINVTSSASGSVSASVSANKETLPPYIIASGSDASLLSSFISSGGSTEGTSGGSTGGTTGGSGIPINLTTLQPIVVPYGLLHNSNVQTAGNTSGLYVDRCRHSIGIVARGEIPLTESTLSIGNNLFNFIDPTSGSGVSANGVGVNADYYDIDIIKTAYAKTHTPGTPPALAGRPAATSYLLNQRFFGLRGPITLHGWGYDTEGFPIPNAADEPKSLDDIGRPLRFELTPDNKNDLTKDGKYDPKTYNLGDIIGKGYDKSSGEWVKTKSPYFYLNWAERADLWPVGPIDLRWDEQRRVWAPANNNTTTYKMIYVTLEEDLVKEDGFDETYVARGFLDDVEYSTQALPANARRLVYIKDRSGFTAPRGAKLLCKYDADSGLYEPISKPTFMVFGLIGSGTSATLELAYIQGLKRGEVVPTFVTTFDNSKFKFKLTSGKTGMFMFLNGSWLLISVEQ